MIKYKATLDRMDIPEEQRDNLDAYVEVQLDISGSDTFIKVDLHDFRCALKEHYDVEETYGKAYVDFMTWLEQITSADEVLILYWW